MSAYAQDYGYFFNSNNSDRKYSADSFETWLKPFFVSGVFEGGLKVKAQTTPDMTVQVEAGYANLDGKLAFWPSANNMTLAAAPGIYSRIDTIVLRRDNVNRRVSIEVVTGTASSSPVPTAPTRDSDTYELVIAQILVGTGVTAINTADITDTRVDTDICGYVCAAVQTPDFSDLFDQLTAQFETWFDHMKDQLDSDAAGHLQLEVDDTQAMIADPFDATKVYKAGDLCTHEGGLWRRNTWTGTAEAWTPSRWDAVNVDEYISDIDDIEKAIGVIVGDTAPQSLTENQYIFVKNHTSLPMGLYKVKQDLSIGDSITSGNVTQEFRGLGYALLVNDDAVNARIDGTEEDIDGINEKIGDIGFEYMSLSNGVAKTFEFDSVCIFVLIVSRINVSTTTAEGIFIGGTGSSNGHVNAFGTAASNVTVSMSDNMTLSITPSTSNMHAMLIYKKVAQ